MGETMHHDLIEDKLMELGMGLKPGQNVTPLLAKANAEMPEKYRNNVVVTDDRSKEVLDRLSERRRARIIEGEAKLALVTSESDAV
ncbi:MAG: hypothetical protein IH946_05155 [Bacteroidetes bacterium]|nr:hypothetical protein [Bacteroidota bacterium]